MTATNDWTPFEEGQTLGRPGSESGVISNDEEHSAGARITLERDATVAPFAITCGVYGWFFHTRFFSSEAQAVAAFKEMKIELARITELIPTMEEDSAEARSPVFQAIADFVERFP